MTVRNSEELSFTSRKRSQSFSSIPPMMVWYALSDWVIGWISKTEGPRPIAHCLGTLPESSRGIWRSYPRAGLAFSFANPIMIWIKMTVIIFEVLLQDMSRIKHIKNGQRPRGFRESLACSGSTGTGGWPSHCFRPLYRPSTSSCWTSSLFRWPKGGI